MRTGGGEWTPDPPANLIAGLTPGEAPADADADGMADAWESENGLDPANGDDHATVMASGYAAIEEYVNGLSDDLVGAAPIAARTDTGTGRTSTEPDDATGTGADTSGDGDAAPPAATDGTVTPVAADSDSDNSSTLAVIALVVPAVALVVAGFAACTP